MDEQTTQPTPPAIASAPDSQPGTGNVVDATTLDQPQELDPVAPEPQVTTREGLLGIAQQQQEGAQADVERIRARQSGEEQALQATLQALTGQEQFQQQIREQVGLPDLEAQLSDISSQIAAENSLAPARLLQAESDVIGTGVTKAFLNQRLSNRERENTIRALTLSAQGQLIQGQVDAANTRVQQAIDLKFEPLKAQLEVQKFNLDRIDSQVESGERKLSAAEEKEFNLQKEAVQKKEQDVEQAKSFAAEIIKNGAPAAIQQQVLAAESLDDVLEIPGIGTYLRTQTERLQAAKISHELNQARKAARAAEKAAEEGVIGRDQLEDAKKFRDEIGKNQSYKDVQKLQANVAGFMSALEDPSGVSDISLVNNFQRIAVDPGVAVREGDVALLRSAQSLSQQLDTKKKGLQRGRKLSDEVRTQMANLVEDMYSKNVVLAETAINPIKNSATATGFDDLQFSTYIAEDIKSVDELRDLARDVQEEIETDAVQGESSEDFLSNSVRDLTSPSESVINSNLSGSSYFQSVLN